MQMVDVRTSLKAIRATQPGITVWFMLGFINVIPYYPGHSTKEMAPGAACKPGEGQGLSHGNEFSISQGMFQTS